MGMPNLPDIPEDAYNQYSQDQFTQQNQNRIQQFSFSQNNASRIAGLGMPGFEVPEIASTSVMQANPQIQLPPIPTPQIPAMPQIPLGQPAPQPLPQPAPMPAPPQQPIIGAPPAPMPMTIAPPVQQPLGTPAPQPVPRNVGGAATPPAAGELTPPGVPSGPPDVNGPARPVWGDSTTPSTTTTTMTTTTTTPQGTTTTSSQPVSYDPTAPAMQALNAAPAGDLQNYARQAASKAGINPEIFAAQIQQESGYNPNAGSSAGAQGIAQIVPKYHPGVDPWDPHASLDYAANLMASLLKQYGGDWQKALIAYNGGSGAVQAWDSGQGYDESKTYVSRILGNSQPNQGNLGTTPSQTTPSTSSPQTAPTQTAMNQSQFGDKELTAAEAYAACGPAAAVRFAQAYGRNPTLREATDLAATVGWTPGSGMAGIGSEQQLMSKMGIPTKLVGNDISAIAAEAQTGNPVTISTPGHYFEADGYNPQTGQFHVGRSGLDLRRGSEWMTADQMQSLMGPIQGALFADHPTIQSNSTTQTDAAAPLDNLKQQAQNIFSNFPGSTTSPTQSLPGSSNPQVAQLNRAVEVAYLPSTQPQAAPDVTGITSAASDNPLANLGNVIGNAVTSALQAAFGGGGPPGGNDRRSWDPTQQSDQTDQPQDVNSRARQMYEQLQTLPGGKKLSDVTGLPDPLPPDLTNAKSPLDALKAVIDNAGQTALNLPRPSPGPGGLGIYDPRLGNDPRMDIPDALEPLGKIGEAVADFLGRGEGTAGRVGAALDRAFETEASAGTRELTGGASQDALDAVQQAGEILSSNAASPMADAARAGEDSLASSLSRTRAQQVWDTVVRNATDSGTDLNNVEKDLATKLGRPLTDSERIGLLARVDPTHQAERAFEDNVGQPLRDIVSAGGQDALKDFSSLVEQRTNQSVAEGQAKLAEQQYLQGGIPDNVTRRADEANAELDRAQTAHAQALADQRAIDAGSGYRTRQSISLDSAGQRVSSAQDDLDAAIEHAHNAAAAQAHDATMRGPQGELVRRPEQRDLIIANSDAARAQSRFERLMARDENVPIAPQGQNNSVRRAYERQVQVAARQAGYAQDRASQLRAAMGENTATREANVTARAAQAAQDALNQGKIAQTPELAAAKVRLQYEQKNLERLQSQKAAGQQGLVDDLARAFKKVQKAQRDVQQATQDLPEAAKAQGWAQLHGRTFSGPGGTPIHYDDVVQQIQDIRSKYANQPKVLDAFDNGLQAIQNHRTQQLQEMVDHGVLAQSDMDKLLDTYDFWTPTRVMDYMSDDRPGIGMGAGGRFNVSSPGMLSYTPEGTSAVHEDHLAALLRDTYEHKSRIARNDVSQAIINGYGGDGSVMKKIAGGVKEYEDSGRTMLPPNYSLKSSENKITAMVNGQRQDYVTNNKLLSTAIEQMKGGGDTSWLQQALMKPAQLTRELAVQRNPGFVPVNLARDTVAYALRNMAEAGVGGNLASAAVNLGPAALTAAATDPNDPNRGQKIAAALALGMGGRMAIGRNLGLGPSAMRAYLGGLADSMHGLTTGRMSGEGVAELERLGGGMRGGGFFSGGVGRGPEAAQQELDRITRGNALTIRNAGDLKQVLGDLAGFGWSKALGNRLEAAPRVATMRLALERGSSPLEAMIKARDVTTDFNRGGRISRELNRYVPFFNVGTQAPAQLGRLIKDHPAGAALAGMTLLSAPAAATEAWNNSDPQRAQDYADVPDYLKRMGIVIMAPGDAPRDAQGNRVPQKFFLPIPNEFMPFVEGGREGYNRIPGVGGKPRSAGDLAKALTQELSPLQVDSPEGAIYGQVPAPFGTAAQLGLNQDLFRGSTIANQYSDENASNLSKTLAPILTDLITQLPNQQMDRIHPSQIDFAIKDALSGPGQQLLNVTDEASGRQARVPGTATETPVVGSLLGRFVRGTGGQLLSDARGETLTPSAAKALRDGGVTWQPSPVRGQIGRMPLLQAEQAQLQQETNKELDNALQRTIRSSLWDTASPTIRQKLVDRASTAARTRAEATVMRSVPLADRQQRVRDAAQKARA